MRAGRLVSLLLILQARGRVTAADLARQLEVSERTILRDIDELSGAGVPIYASRGPGGGFQLLEGFRIDVPSPAGGSSVVDRRSRNGRRVRVRISPEGRRLAAVLQVLQPLRVSRTATDGGTWLEASFRMRTADATIVELLSLGPHVEVLAPPDLRRAVASCLREAALLYEDDLHEDDRR